MFNQQKQHYGIRKYAIGTSSVLLGVTLFITHDATASATENNTPAKTETNQAETTSSHTSPTDVTQPNADTNASTTTKETTQQTDQTTSPQEQTQPKADQTAPKDTSDINQTQTADSTTAPPVTDAPKANDDTTHPESATVAKKEDTQTAPTADNTPQAQQPPQSEASQEVQQQATVEDATPQQNASTEVQPKNVGAASTKQEQHTNKSTAPTPYAQQADKATTDVTIKSVDSNAQPSSPAQDQPEDANTADKATVATPPRDNAKTADPNKTMTRAAATQQDDAVDTLTSKEMTATIDKSFPAVKYYTLKNGKKVDAQVTDARQIIVNGEVITPTVKYNKIDDHTAEYDLTAQNDSRSIDANFKFRLSVEGQTVDLQMTDYTNNNTDPQNVIRNFGFVSQSLVSVNNQQKNAKLQTTKMSTNTMQSGDKSYNIDENFKNNFNDFMMYGFVSNDDYSAGLWSNAQIGFGGDQDFLRVNAQSTETDNGVAVGLGSMPWFIQKDAEHPDAKDQGLLPHVKIAIAEDENKDGEINWQDGAIAYRSIMNNPYGAEEVPDLVGYRIAMNFGSQAQNPFLKTLDGVKKFYLNTDGLGQSILLKGYNSEGHDSSHLDYDNIGQRMGGVKDFKTLLQKGANYGARFGLHINASETYPESKAFDPDLLRKNEDGTYMYGWNWLDQGFNIDADYDLTHGRKARFEALKRIVGDDLDFIYVDVWGNGQSGDNSAWPSHQLAKEINDLGWRVGVEWGHGMEYDSTFQHWAADLTYGTYQNKGINSEVARFLRNHQKDSWVGHYPKYSGAADFPLLGGYDMKDFEGWQGRNDYSAYIKNIFNVDLPTKFLQHYKVMRIVDGDPVKMTANGQTIDWTPEMQVDLQNEAGDKVTVKRKSNDYQNDIDNYRSRTMELNGRTVLDGDSYLLPWDWDSNGQPLTGDNEKLYHWNKNGGSTTWTLPESWDTDQVVLYELTETGRKSPRTVAVKDHQVTLDNIKADTPYVIYKVAQPDNTDVNWSEDMHVKDAGFNSQQLTPWTIEGNQDKVSIEKSTTSNEMLKIDSPTKTTKLTQQLTGLVPGQRYAVYVGVDNRSNAAAHIAVTHHGETLASNETGQSIAKNYVKADAHNNNAATFKNGGSYFQNMYVYFVAPEDGKADFTIQRDPGEGATYFDDIRVLESNANLLQNGTFNQDFENVPQGLFPFVVSEVEGVEDNRVHLSEKNAPYTQRGWNNKRVDDVIDGKWSLKVNGQTGKDKMVIQTVPQNFYFEPGKTYEVSFDYEAGSDDTYAFATGSGDISKNRNFEQTPLKNTVDGGKAKRVTFKVTGDENGQTWIGIYSTKTPNDPRGVKEGNQINFEGTKDFILDNLSIREVEAPKPDTTQENGDSAPMNGTDDSNANPSNAPDNNSDTTDVNVSATTDNTEVKGVMTTNGTDAPTVTLPEATTGDEGASNPITTTPTNQVLPPMHPTAAPMQHGMDNAPTEQAPVQVENVAAQSLPDDHLTELPKTGDMTQNTRGALMAMMVGAVLTAFGFRRQRKEK
ncbi:YSIRK-type signal peptide-containing protein [Staphylococcus ursi]|uniref:endo-alpha-N-acetylgalactosaminidase family protein n=1 Tax=Staphylococcus sp. MI 10-1553 TaxID=1912064 RepID=UPI0013996B53|nr:endo-alpha-N-acetylgalactosaminidase family protein [Staphylococcus sp. MI 10-1553]QHW36063.1 YSIRK-type signal peptide-containing protein [Staphylococcus sp. MI 10-1553]